MTWAIDKGSDAGPYSSRRVDVLDERGKPCATMYGTGSEARDKARRIVRAVNSHEGLLAACKLMRAHITALQENFDMRWMDWPGAFEIEAIITSAEKQ
jgi:hypothetical protein